MWKFDVKIDTQNGVYTSLDIKHSDKKNSYGFTTPLDTKGAPDWTKKVIKKKVK